MRSVKLQIIPQWESVTRHAYFDISYVKLYFPIIREFYDLDTVKTLFNRIHLSFSVNQNDDNDIR